MKLKYSFTLLFTGLALRSLAQAGSVHWVFTPKQGLPIERTIAIPYTKFGEYTNTWFIHPVTGKANAIVFSDGALSIDIASHRDTDITYDYDHRSLSELNLAFVQKPVASWIKPDNTLGPVHIHFITFTAGELYFTFEGPAGYDAITSEYNATPAHVTGWLSGAVHIYRDPRYEQTAKLPGCDCDPSIYAIVYGDGARTASDCESAYMWKVFNQIKPALSPLLDIVSPQQQGTAAPGTILNQSENLAGGQPDRIDMALRNTPADFCSPFNYKFSQATIGQETRVMNQNIYGYTFLIMQGKAAADGLGAADKQATDAAAANMPAMSKLMKQVMNKEITAAEYNKQMDIIKAKIAAVVTATAPDFKKMEVEEVLSVKVYINATQSSVTQFPLAAGGATGQLQHNIPGSAFELIAPLVKLNDGNWLPDRLYIYLGKFTAPRLDPRDNTYEVCDPVIPANGNRLTTYNMIVKLSGKPELMQQALAKIDFNALEQMIAKQ